MNIDRLEEIRRRVEAQKSQREALSLLRGLYHSDEIDPSVCYMTSKEVAEALGVEIHTVQAHVRSGRLRALAEYKGTTLRNGKRMKRGHNPRRWLVHPDDFEAYRRKLILEKRNGG